MKKLRLPYLLLSFMLLLLTACGTQSNDTVASSVTTESIAIETQLNSFETESETPITEKQTEAKIQTEVPITEAQTEPIAKDVTVHFLDVGQGLSILVQSGGQTLIYDGGNTNTSSFVVAYLKAQGISKIDYLISSHYDSDHVAGLIGCLNAFDVGTVIGSDYVHDSKLYTSFINAVQEAGLSVEHPVVGTEYVFGTGSITILSPAVIGSDSNSNSVAIKLTNGENSFIFTGDAESISESQMVNSGIDLLCDVLSIGHHGSATSTSYEFLQATLPEFAVISCGVDNSYGHPDADTMDKLASMEIAVYRNDMQGTIIVHSDGSTLITWNQEPCNNYLPGSSTDMGTQPQVETDAPIVEEEQPAIMVWKSATGSKYHSINNCGNMNPNKATQITLEQAESMELGRCSNCW